MTMSLPHVFPLYDFVLGSKGEYSTMKPLFLITHYHSSCIFPVQERKNADVSDDF